jgi:hypothetical protein
MLVESLSFKTFLLPADGFPNHTREEVSLNLPGVEVSSPATDWLS